MSHSMGNVRSSLYRLVTNYNVQNRAERQVDRMQRDAMSAPKHKRDAERVEAALQDHPQLQDAVRLKDEGLARMLDSVRVVSSSLPAAPHDRLPGHRPDTPTNRPLPAKHTDELPTSSFFFIEPPPERIPPGKITLRELYNLTQEHQSSHGALAGRELMEMCNNRISEEDLRKLLRYAGVFQHAAQAETVRTSAYTLAKAEEGQGMPQFKRYSTKEEIVKRVEAAEIARIQADAHAAEVSDAKSANTNKAHSEEIPVTETETVPVVSSDSLMTKTRTQTEADKKASNNNDQKLGFVR